MAISQSVKANWKTESLSIRMLKVSWISRLRSHAPINNPVITSRTHPDFRRQPLKKSPIYLPPAGILRKKQDTPAYCWAVSTSSDSTADAYTR